jgi:hypothetical protein
MLTFRSPPARTDFGTLHPLHPTDYEKLTLQEHPSAGRLPSRSLKFQRRAVTDAVASALRAFVLVCHVYPATMPTIPDLIER